MVMMCRMGMGMVFERAWMFMAYRSIQCRSVGSDLWRGRIKCITLGEGGAGGEGGGGERLERLCCEEASAQEKTGGGQRRTGRAGS